jgi:hypothetical protein
MPDIAGKVSAARIIPGMQYDRSGGKARGPRPDMVLSPSPAQGAVLHKRQHRLIREDRRRVGIKAKEETPRHQDTKGTEKKHGFRL